MKKLKFWRKRKNNEDELSAVFEDRIIRLQTQVFERDLYQKRVVYAFRKRVAQLEQQLKARDFESEIIEAQRKKMERVHKETEAILRAKIDQLRNEHEERMKILEELEDEVKDLKKWIVDKFIDGLCDCYH